MISFNHDSFCSSGWGDILDLVNKYAKICARERKRDLDLAKVFFPFCFFSPFFNTFLTCFSTHTHPNKIILQHNLYHHISYINKCFPFHQDLKRTWNKRATCIFVTFWPCTKCIISHTNHHGWSTQSTEYSFKSYHTLILNVWLQKTLKQKS